MSGMRSSLSSASIRPDTADADRPYAVSGEVARASSGALPRRIPGVPIFRTRRSGRMSRGGPSSSIRRS